MTITSEQLRQIVARLKLGPAFPNETRDGTTHLILRKYPQMRWTAIAAKQVCGTLN